MDFEELHGKGGSNANVGVDLTTLMTSQVAISTVGESDGGASGGGDMTVPRIASFQVYWDVHGKQFKVFNPKVIDPSGNEIAVTETVLSRGTYVCEVKKNATTNVYTAAIKLIDSIVPSVEAVTVVKLFKIEDGKVEQYHVGAIILGSNGGSSSNPAAFDLEVSESSTGLKTGKIVRCNFMFDGVKKSLHSDGFPVSGSGSVYLVAKQPAPSSSTGGDPPWSFELSESEGEAAQGGRVVNYKLYDLSDFAVTCDYRTTFMEINSPHRVSDFVVCKPEASGSDPLVRIKAYEELKASIEITTGNLLKYAKTEAYGTRTQQILSAGANIYVICDANTNALGSSVQIKNGSKSIVLRTADLDNLRNEIQFHTLTVKDADGDEEKFTVLASSDIEIFKAKGTVLKDVELKYENYELQMKKTTIDLETGKETVGEFETVFETEAHSEQ